MTLDIEGIVAQRYCPSEGWLTLTEVADAPGFSGNRRMDMAAIGCWASNAMHVIGFEIKRSVADWRKELEQPGKRAPFVERCNEFCFVAPWKIIDPKEVPEGCGLLSIDDAGKLKRRVVAAQREPSKPFERRFLTSLFRAALRRVEDSERATQDFAQYRGKPIGIDALRAVAQRVTDHLHQTRMKMLTDAVQYRDERKKRAQRWEDAMHACASLGRWLQGADKSWRNDDYPEAVVQACAYIREVKRGDGGAIAAKLRELADQLDQPTP